MYKSFDSFPKIAEARWMLSERNGGKRRAGGPDELEPYRGRGHQALDHRSAAVPALPRHPTPLPLFSVPGSLGKLETNVARDARDVLRDESVD
jgi:hypothetical protein